MLELFYVFFFLFSFRLLIILKCMRHLHFQFGSMHCLSLEFHLFVDAILVGKTEWPTFNVSNWEPLSKYIRPVEEKLLNKEKNEKSSSWKDHIINTISGVCWIPLCWIEFIIMNVHHVALLLELSCSLMISSNKFVSFLLPFSGKRAEVNPI